MVFILISWSLNNRSYTRLGIDTLDDNGIEFKILNLVELLYGKKDALLKSTMKNDNEIIIQSWEELKTYLREDRVVLNFLNIKRETLRVFWLLSRLHIDYVSFSNMPLPSKSNKKLQIINLLLKSAKYGAVVKEQTTFPFSKKTKFIKIHSIDYDTMLRFEKDKPSPIIEEPYIVFLDQNLPFHLDFVRNNTNSYVTAEAYYKALNNYFKYVEEITGKRVVIALHPSCEKETYPEYREIKNETINLIKYSDAVLLHSSTAISFAILYEKPVSMIVTDEIESSSMQTFNQLLSEKLDIPMINVDNEKKVNFIYAKHEFEAYKKEFISDSNYRDILSMEIVLQELK